MQDSVQHNNKMIIGAIVLAGVILTTGIWYIFFNIRNDESGDSVEELKKTQSVRQIVSLRSASSTTAIRPLLPKSKVNDAYASIYTAIINETMGLMNTGNNDMAPLLSQTQTALRNKDYATLASIGDQAMRLNEVQKKHLAILSADFDNLALVSKSLDDKETIALTNDFTTAGKAMVVAYSAMSELIDDLNTGDLSAQAPTEAKVIMNNLTTTGTAFNAATKKLVDYFITTLVSDTKTYIAEHPELATSTPSL